MIFQLDSGLQIQQNQEDEYHPEKGRVYRAFLLSPEAFEIKVEIEYS